MLKKCVSFALVLVLTLAFVSVTKSAEVGKITVNPASESVLKGELLKVDIRAKDLSEVYALSFEIKYESAILFFEDHEWGSFISKDVEPVKHFAKPSSGRLMITVSNVDGKTDLPTGPATICTIKFKGIMASGNSPIKIEKIEARKRNFEEIELEGENASVIVTSPPTKPELVVKRLSWILEHSNWASARRYLSTHITWAKRDSRALPRVRISGLRRSQSSSRVKILTSISLCVLERV